MPPRGNHPPLLPSCLPVYSPGLARALRACAAPHALRTLLSQMRQKAKAEAAAGGDAKKDK